MNLLFLFSIISIGLCLAEKKVPLTAEQSARLLQHSMQCIVETGVNTEVIVQLKSGMISDDEKFKKFLFCVFKKAALVSKDGRMKIDKVINQFPKTVDKEPIKKVLEDCNKLDGKDRVERSFNIFKCYHTNTPVHLAF